MESDTVVIERYLLISVIVKYLALTYFRTRMEAVTWLSTPNPHLENKSPQKLILAGEAGKVWQFILSREYDRGDIEDL